MSSALRGEGAAVSVGRSLRWPLLLTAAVLIAAWLIGGPAALGAVAVLAVLEVSLSFDNAVVNATVLRRMNRTWQTIFLTVGILVAVFGMRLAFPLLLVGITAGIGPSEVVELALEGGAAQTPGTYAALLHEAHPAIAAFGGVFLLMLFLDFVLEEREIVWLAWFERPLARIGKLDQVSVVAALSVLLVASQTLTEHPITVLVAGVLGMVSYLVVNGLGELFTQDRGSEDGDGAEHQAVPASGRAAFFLFLYLELLDASFSFDGVIGAFAVSDNIFVIAAGLGVGALYIRSFTVILVNRGSLQEYAHLEHGAMWAIGALAAVLLASLRYEVPEVVTGLLGVGFIAVALLSSIRRNRTAERAVVEVHPDPQPVTRG